MLQAKSISRALVDEMLRPGLKGEVHSTFARACNLLLANRLIGLVAPSLGNGPDAILVEPPLGGFASAWEWQPGTQVRFESEQLLLSGGGGLILKGALCWDPEPVRPQTVGDLAASAGELGPALQALGPAGGIHEHVLALWEGQPYPAGPLALASPRLGALREACLSGQPDLAGQCAYSLVGLGPGLTPSGDDFLAGLTAALTLAVRWGMAPDFLTVVTGALGRLLSDGCRDRTTLPSETMLRSAARGWLVEAASDLATGLLGGVKGSMTHLPAVLALGHTSGADTAAGIYMALRLLGHSQAGTG